MLIARILTIAVRIKYFVLVAHLGMIEQMRNYKLLRVCQLPHQQNRLYRVLLSVGS